MLIAILSDSHDNLTSVDKALEILRSRNVSYVIHLGDIVSPFTMLKLLQYPARFVFVLGNNDGDVLTLKELAYKAGAIVKQQVHEFSIRDRKLLAIHGFGSKDLTEKIVYSVAQSAHYDIVLYGHTHSLKIERIGKTLIINPGELCGYLTGKRTFVLLDVDTMSYEIVEF